MFRCTMVRCTGLPVSAALLALSAACSTRSDAPSAAATMPRVTYEGVFATGSRGGIVQLVSGSPATGTLSMKGGSTIALVGTYNTATESFAMTGGGYSVNASADGAHHVAGPLSASTAAASGVLTAYSTDAAPQIKVCGTFSGSMSGTLNAVVSGSNISAVAVDAAGNGMTANGTLNGSAISFEWKPLGTIPSNVTGSATGSLTGPTSGAGTWQLSNGQKGSWTAAGC